VSVPIYATDILKPVLF